MHFLKLTNLALDSWRPHRDSKRCKQDPDRINSDISEDSLVGESEEALGQISGTPSKGGAA